MLDNPPLLTIHRNFRRPDPALVARFRGAQTSHLVDAMDGRGALDWRIKPLDPTVASFAGPALTAFAYPADILALFGALQEAQPGDVIVMAHDGFTRTAIIGDIAAGLLRNKGVAAFVTDGLARDRAGIVATGLPLFCAGIVPNSPAMNGPGTVGAPVTLGDVHARATSSLAMPTVSSLSHRNGLPACSIGSTRFAPPRRAPNNWCATAQPCLMVCAAC